MPLPSGPLWPGFVVTIYELNRSFKKLFVKDDYKLFVSGIFTWSYNYSLRNIISHLKPDNCVYRLLSNRNNYSKLYKYLYVVLYRNTWYHRTGRKISQETTTQQISI